MPSAGNGSRSRWAALCAVVTVAVTGGAAAPALAGQDASAYLYEFNNAGQVVYTKGAGWFYSYGEVLRASDYYADGTGVYAKVDKWTSSGWSFVGSVSNKSGANTSKDNNLSIAEGVDVRLTACVLHADDSRTNCVTTYGTA